MTQSADRPAVPSGLSDEKYRVLVDAGMAEFGEHGYGPASMRRLAQRAGVSKALPFHYFDSKKGLFLHLYELGMAVLHERLAPAAPHPGDDLFDAVHRMTVAKCRLSTAYPALSAFMVRAWFEEDPDVHSDVRAASASPLHRQREQLLRLAEKTPLRAPATPERAVDLVLWMAEGFGRTLVDLASLDDAELESAVTAYIEMLRVGMDPEAGR